MLDIYLDTIVYTKAMPKVLHLFKIINNFSFETIQKSAIPKTL